MERAGLGQSSHGMYEQELGVNSWLGAGSLSASAL